MVSKMSFTFLSLEQQAEVMTMLQQLVDDAKAMEAEAVRAENSLALVGAEFSAPSDLTKILQGFNEALPFCPGKVS